MSGLINARLNIFGMLFVAIHMAIVMAPIATAQDKKMAEVTKKIKTTKLEEEIFYHLDRGDKRQANVAVKSLRILEYNHIALSYAIGVVLSSALVRRFLKDKKDLAMYHLGYFIRKAKDEKYKERVKDAQTMLDALLNNKPIYFGKVLDQKIINSFKPKKKKLSRIPPNMAYVPGGCFDMGDFLLGGLDRQVPIHLVCLDDYFIDIYEVTQDEYEKVIGRNPSKFKKCGDDCPVDSVSWVDAKRYCKKVGKRLPTEAEWEYAARSGGKRENLAGGLDIIVVVAWYKENSGGSTHPVGQKWVNGLGLYDMNGNVGEWVNDWADSFRDRYYSKSPIYNPQGPKKGESHVQRGGGWDNDDFSTTTSFRFSEAHFSGSLIPSTSGFRCAK